MLKLNNVAFVCTRRALSPRSNDVGEHIRSDDNRARAAAAASYYYYCSGSGSDRFINLDKYERRSQMIRVPHQMMKWCPCHLILVTVHPASCSTLMVTIWHDLQWSVTHHTPTHRATTINWQYTVSQNIMMKNNIFQVLASWEQNDVQRQLENLPYLDAFQTI